MYWNEQLILSTVLFLMYINNSLDSYWNGEIISYAVHTTFIFTGIDWNDVLLKWETELNQMKKWLEMNPLTLITNNSKFISLGPYSSKLPSTFRILIHDHNCKRNPCICNKAICTNRVNLFYKLLIESIHNYGIFLWNNACYDNCKCFLVAQRYIIKIMRYFFETSHTIIKILIIENFII